MVLTHLSRTGAQDKHKDIVRLEQSIVELHQVSLLPSRPPSTASTPLTSLLLPFSSFPSWDWAKVRGRVVVMTWKAAEHRGREREGDSERY